MIKQSKTVLDSPLSRIFIAILILLVTAMPTLAGIRTSITYSNFINPESTDTLANVFRSGGDFRIAGGVTFHGQAQFYLERKNSNQMAVSASALSLTVEDTGNIFIKHNGKPYKIEMLNGIACPIGKFVIRGGIIAFTVPPENDKAAKAQMARAGLVDTEDGIVAKEFVDTRFVPLLLSADFAIDEPLPQALQTDIIKKLNTAVGAERDLLKESDGSFLNSDHQVTYQVFLVDERPSGRVDITGVPLRYYWEYADDRSALVTNVSALSQNWPKSQTLTSIGSSESVLESVMASIFTGVNQYQYHVVNLYQIVGVFRQLHSANPREFKTFVSDACNL